MWDRQDHVLVATKTGFSANGHSVSLNILWRQNLRRDDPVWNELVKKPPRKTISFKTGFLFYKNTSVQITESFLRLLHVHAFNNL